MTRSPAHVNRTVPTRRRRDPECAPWGPLQPGSHGGPTADMGRRPGTVNATQRRGGCRVGVSRTQHLTALHCLASEPVSSWSGVQGHPRNGIWRSVADPCAHRLSTDIKGVRFPTCPTTPDLRMEEVSLMEAAWSEPPIRLPP
jgi:hypothetical protein